MRFSVIIPVYNRPDEVEELLGSLVEAVVAGMEVIVVEDGSQVTCEKIAERFADRLDLKYFTKENTGPGDTRNFGAARATGDYLVFFDSDCMVPPDYFAEVEMELAGAPVDAWGGPDRAAGTFTTVQKAINYSMTSFLTTGGIRGRKKGLDKFYARSFNMGVNRKVFESIGGFSPMRIGEDIDLSARLFAAGYTVRLMPGAWVYHKRRTNFRQFRRQVTAFGKARVVLSRLHPGITKPVHLLPALFVVGMAAVVVTAFFWPWMLLLPSVYFAAVLVDSSIRSRSFYVGLLSVPAAAIQLGGYGCGFITALFCRYYN